MEFTLEESCESILVSLAEVHKRFVLRCDERRRVGVVDVLCSARDQGIQKEEEYAVRN